MTTSQLAAGYHRKCADRLAMLDVLMARQAWSDVVRESQEIMELGLKGILRAVGIDPPKWHDVGCLLVEYGARITSLTPDQIRKLAEASALLRKEREFSFYGDVDFIPTDQYDESDAQRAFDYAREATTALGKVLGGLPPDEERLKQ